MSKQVRAIVFGIAVAIVAVTAAAVMIRAGESSKPLRHGRTTLPEDDSDRSKRHVDFSQVTVTPEAISTAKSSNVFAFDLYQQLRTESGNLSFSPASISTALAMASAGAGGETRDQMRNVLKAELPEQQLHSGHGTLVKLLNSHSDGYRLSMANRLWGQQSFNLRPDFLNVTREQYGAELARVDFAQAEAARRTINDWIEEHTDDKITDLIPPEQIDDMTRLVLTNAIYFKGKWDEEFTTELTDDAPFHLTTDETATVPLMYQFDDFRYADGDGWQLLELPYFGQEIAMLILLPKVADELTGVEAELSAENFDQWMTNLKRKEVKVYLPRFKLDAEFQLKDALSALGMPVAFTDAADFSGITSDEPLKIDAVIHKAFVDVNEEGTEAAAATAVGVATASAVVSEPVVFRADHPFVFLIRDQRTGVILFMGRVSDPRS